MTKVQSDATVGKVSYTAKRTGAPAAANTQFTPVSLHASGRNPTPNYTTVLKDAGSSDDVPRALLENIRPEGLQPEVVTSFECDFQWLLVPTKASKVKVTDHDGEHDVRIQPNDNPGPIGPR